MSEPKILIGFWGCPACAGTGDEMCDSASALGIPGGWVPVGPCPACGGSGVSINEAMIDRAMVEFKKFWDSPIEVSSSDRETCRAMLEAALREGHHQ